MYALATVNTGRLTSTNSRPNSGEMAGYVNRGTFIDLDKLFKLTKIKIVKEGLTQDIQSEIVPFTRQEVLQLKSLKEHLEIRETEAHNSVKIVDIPQFSLWKFFNPKMTKVFFIKHDKLKRCFQRSVTYMSDEMARLRHATGKITWSEVIPESPSPK
jgi:hypothetical protein